MESHTILIVEDEDESREVLTQILELEGFKVVATANGAEAWEYLHHADPPCLIVLDIFMPVMDGRQFRALQLQDQNLAKIPTVVVSALSPSETVDLRATIVIPKPLDVAALIGVIRANC
jgi:CheY-like chemotaxis protein